MSAVEIQAYCPKRHYPTVALWEEEHGLSPTPPDLFPKIGFFVPSTCAGFLYQTDSNVALIEGLITSPLSDPERRDEALDIVVEALLEEAKKLGYSVVYGFTSVSAVSRRALRLGFEKSPKPYQLVTRRL
jgi:hypothetical protein